VSEVRTLVIDGKDVAATSDQSILSAARENGVHIPTLCHLEGLSEVGACRLCVVEIEGSNKLLAACATKVEEGMQVTTASERLVKYRGNMVELFFLERNHVCAVCVANNNCELQDQARDLELTHFELPPLHPELTVDATHERFVLDQNRCILCTRCVRVCDEVEGAHTWDIQGRGANARLVSDLDAPWGSSTTCTSCGKCVQVCPTGALFEKGRSVSEPKARRPYLPYLIRAQQRHGS
jgi:bidirectional [NiFe] hydrogenase diaphorase subunit